MDTQTFPFFLEILTTYVVLQLKASFVLELVDTSKILHRLYFLRVSSALAATYASNHMRLLKYWQYCAQSNLSEHALNTRLHTFTLRTLTVTA